MANKSKKMISNNLIDIMTRLNVNEIDLSKLFGVTKEMISNYVNGVSNFPLEYAMILSEKYNLSLDYIYNNKHQEKLMYLKNSNDGLELSIVNHSKIERLNFLVDIKDFITYSNGNINFTIREDYIKYLLETDKILNQKVFTYEKNVNLAKLNALQDFSELKYPFISWNLSIKLDKFITMMNFERNQTVHYVDNLHISKSTPTKEQIDEATHFLEMLFSESIE